MRIEEWPVGRLHMYANNPRKNDYAVERMVAVLTEFGFRVPILAKADGEIIDGHLRYKAALAMNMEAVPVIVADGMTDVQIRAFRIMVNRSATWADWDEELLLAEVQKLSDANYDLSLTGFDYDEICSIRDAAAAIEDNEDGAREIDPLEYEDTSFEFECPRCKFHFNEAK